MNGLNKWVDEWIEWNGLYIEINDQIDQINRTHRMERQCGRGKFLTTWKEV